MGSSGRLAELQSSAAFSREQVRERLRFKQCHGVPSLAFSIIPFLRRGAI